MLMRIPSSAFLALSLVCLPLAAPAQTGMITGTVTDSATGAPLSSATVRLTPSAGDVLTGLTNRLGNFRFSELPSGAYTLLVVRLGYSSREITAINLAAGQTREVSIPMTVVRLTLNPIVVSAARDEQAAIDAPASVSVVNRETVEDRTVLSPIDHIIGLPGVESLEGGLTQRQYTVRGSNFGTSSQIRTLSDYRYTVLPSIDLNVPYFFAPNNDDIERIEILRGPAAALWGPQTNRGVLHIVTRSPFESRGTTVSFAGGERSVAQGTLRHAGVVGDRFAFKISGQYMRGNDWEFADSVEAATRTALLAGGARPDTLLVGLRDYATELLSGEVRLDWRPDDETEIITSGGIGHTFNTMDLLTFGNPARLREAGTSYVQARMTRGRFFANVFVNKNNIDDGFITANGFRLKDKSLAMAGQLQHGFDVGQNQKFLYGLEIQRTVSRTDNTIHTFTEDRDNLTEFGVYLHSETGLTPNLDFVASGRLDHHSVVGGVSISPNLALVIKPAPAHAVRLTYGRGSYTPGAGVLFIDFPVANFNPLPYNVRSVGLHEALTFRRNCGGPCMRSPFNPESAGGPAAYLPIDATLQWPAVVALLQAQGIDLSALPAPTAAQVASVMGRLNLTTLGFDPVTAGDVVDADAWERGFNTAVEVGYKGLIGERLLLGIDVHYNDFSPIASLRTIATPNVFFDPVTLGAYLGSFLPPAQADPLVAAIAAIPIGTVTPEQAASPTDLQLIQRQGGGVTYWGFDFDATLQLDDRFWASAAYSWTSQDSVADAVDRTDFLFNNPKHRASLALNYDDPEAGVKVGLQTRFAGAYPAFNSFRSGRIDSYAVVDVSVSYRLPISQDVTISVDASNVFDNDRRELPGLPAIGRLVLGRVRAHF